MKAVMFSEFGEMDVLKYGDVPQPEAGPGEVVLKIKAAALNFNDIWGRRGLPRVKIPLPHISGSDAAGVVVALGPDVDTLNVGDEVITYPVNSCRRCEACLKGQEVFCRKMKIWGFQTGPLDGAYAEFAKVQAAQCLPKPQGQSWTEAASTTTSLLSVWRMLVTRAQVKAGDSVLIWGASGGTGSFAVQVAKTLGAVPIAVTSSAEKAGFCESMGARHVIRSDKSDVIQEVKTMTQGRGVDVVFDHVGQTVWPASIESLRWGGKIVICGATEGFEPSIDLRYLWNKQLSFLGSHIGTHGEWVDALRLVEHKQVKVPVSKVFGLRDVPKALQLMESRNLLGKIAIEMD
jgi:alcohol dehydrogenase